MASDSNTRRTRTSAEERRQQLIDAALIEFAHGGLHGTPVARIARRVGVAQPYVFSLFPTKRDLFLAAISRGFERVDHAIEDAVRAFEADPVELDHSGHEGPRSPDLLAWIGTRAIEFQVENREILLAQLGAYAACDDEVVRQHVLGCWRDLTRHVQSLTGAGPDELALFFGQGMWLTVLTAIGADSVAGLLAGSASTTAVDAP